MYALSNMYITQTKNKKNLFVLLLLLAVLFSGSLKAQNKAVISPLQKTSLRRFQYDIYVQASGGSHQAMFLPILNNLYNMSMYSYSTHGSLGVSGYINFKSYLGANLGINYTHERIGQNKGLFSNNGVYAGWINADISLSLFCISAGMCFDYFLGSHVVNKDSFSYEGINEHCFHRLSYCTYISFCSIFRRFKMELRTGTYLKPHLNPDKIAYYNTISSIVFADYFEFRVSYRIFTSGNRIKAPERFLIIKGQSI